MKWFIIKFILITDKKQAAVFQFSPKTTSLENLMDLTIFTWLDGGLNQHMWFKNRTVCIIPNKCRCAASKSRFTAKKMDQLFSGSSLTCPKDDIAEEVQWLKPLREWQCLSSNLSYLIDWIGYLTWLSMKFITAEEDQVLCHHIVVMWSQFAQV